MGNWKLEVFKMTIYMSFPVGMFVFFNQPQFFEDWVVKTRRELFPPDNEEDRKNMKEAIAKYNQRYKDQLKKEFEEKYGQKD